ncbi:MAG: hypothetical protein ACLFVA_06825 [Dehalococcoidia bacterium]
MGNFGWVDSLVREPGVNIQRLTTRGQVVVVITSRKYMAVFQRARERKGFSRVSKRKQDEFLRKIKDRGPKTETLSI